MPESVRDIMSANPVSLEKSSSALSAAEAMRDNDIGDVVVTSGGSIYGILTDRDIVIRGLAGRKDPESTPISELCTENPATLSPDDDVQTAVEAMSQKAVRRLPVVENGAPIGIVSLGDLAVERDRRSALADISAARPDH